MSQAKVDRYKEQKRNRKQIMKKEKRNWFLTQLSLVLVGLVVVCWVVVSAFQAITGSSSDTEVLQTTEYTVDSSALDDYIDSLDEN